MRSELTHLRRDFASTRANLVAFRRKDASIRANLVAFRRMDASIRANLGAFRRKDASIRANLVAFRRTDASIRADIVAFRRTDPRVRRDILAFRRTDASIRADIVAFRRKDASIRDDIVAFRRMDASIRRNIVAFRRMDASIRANLVAFRRKDASIRQNIVAFRRKDASIRDDIVAFRRTDPCIRQHIVAFRRTDASIRADIGAFRRKDTSIRSNIAAFRRTDPRVHRDILPFPRTEGRIREDIVSFLRTDPPIRRNIVAFRRTDPCIRQNIVAFRRTDASIRADIVAFRRTDPRAPRDIPAFRRTDPRVRRNILAFLRKDPTVHRSIVASPRKVAPIRRDIAPFPRKLVPLRRNLVAFCHTLTSIRKNVTAFRHKEPPIQPTIVELHRNLPPIRPKQPKLRVTRTPRRERPLPPLPQATEAGAVRRPASSKRAPLRPEDGARFRRARHTASLRVAAHHESDLDLVGKTVGHYVARTDANAPRRERPLPPCPKRRKRAPSAGRLVKRGPRSGRRMVPASVAPSTTHMVRIVSMPGRPRALALASTSLLFSSLAACGSSATAPERDAATDAHQASGDAGKTSRDSATQDTSSPSRDAGHDTGHDVETTDAAPLPDASDAKPPSLGDASFTPGAPITATAAQWTWVPFPDAVCANGTATGIGVNLSTTKDARVLIYLEGGGACWSELTCYSLMTASYFTTGYGEADFTAESTDATYLAQPGGFFDRTSAANPFQDYSYVYVPYCTGDVHAGYNVTQLGTTTANFVGWKNFGEYLDRLVPTFTGTDRVILAGSSAGGFGAALNWWRTQQAFGGVRVDLLDDSGTAMPAAITAEGTPLSTFAVPWNLAATVPAGCTSCSTDLSSLYSYYDTVFATHRAALLSYTQDTVLPTFFGVTTAEFTTGLDDDLAAYFKPTDPFKSFVINAAGHVLFFSPTLATSANVTVQQFVTQMVTDDAAWTDDGP